MACQSNIFSSRRRRGFTVMELTMGMVVMAMVMGAVAGLLGAAGQGWKQAESSEATASSSAQAHLRLRRIFQQARQIGYFQSGSLYTVSAGGEAAALIWKRDTNL